MIVPILLWIHLPSDFRGLQRGAAAPDVPMLGQRKDLIRADRGLPDVDEVVTAEVGDILIGMRVFVRRGDGGRRDNGRVAAPRSLFIVRVRRRRATLGTLLQEAPYVFEARHVLDLDTAHRDVTLGTVARVAVAILPPGAQLWLKRNGIARGRL